MALYATNRFAGDGTTTQYEINFVGQYIDRSHVKAYRVDDATQVRTHVTISPGQWLNATTITGFAPTPVGQTLVIYRDTPKPPLVDFVNGSRFTEYNMDVVARQGLFLAMEALDSGDHEAIDALLAAIEVVTGLVDDATATVSDATQAALEAAASAADAAGYATQAEAARVAAVAARNAAQASAGNAATSETNARNSASAASASATNAANSASAASASANAANTSATNAATSATNAGNSATAAANSASTASTKATEASNSATAAANSASAASDSATAAANYAASINSATFVKLADTQTITGDKTFSLSPKVANVSDPALAPDRALNWASIRARTVLNGWGTQAGVTSNFVYMGWSGLPGGILAQVDVTPMGSVITSDAARTQAMVGALVFGHYIVAQRIAYGTQVPGYDLRAASGNSYAPAGLPGTWVCLGEALGSAVDTDLGAKTLFMRVA